MSERLSKYIAVFDYFDKILIFLSATNALIFNTSFLSTIGIPVGIVSAGFNLLFPLATGIIKKLLKITRNKNKKRKKNVMLTRNKLNRIQILISQALIDSEISH